MERFDTVKAVVVNRGRAAVEKAKDLTEIAKLKAQIMSCEEVIRKNYLEIGQLVYEDYEEKKDAGEEYSVAEGGNWYTKQCVAIANAKKAIEELERRIEELKKG